MLGFSFLAALAIYSALFYLAPGIALLTANSAVREAAEVFRVDLREVVVPIPEIRPLSAITTPGRPSSVRDLLEEEWERIMPEIDHTPAEMPQIAERVAEDAVPREHDLNRDEAMLRKVDARIIEISKDVARRDIEVARRLVKPSPVRVLGPDELPTLREDTGALLDTSPIALPDRPTLAPPTLTAAEPSEEGFDRPEFEEGVLNPQIIEQQGLPELPVETVVAREPVRQAVREESNYDFMDDLVRIELTTYVPPNEPEAYFRVRIAPVNNKAIPILPKDVTFVVDASKSIIQRKLDITVRGVRECIAMLRPEDRFNVVIFRDTPNHFRPQMVYASPAEKSAAAAFLDGLESRGETDVYNAVRPVVETPTREGMAGLVMVLSDGRPTAGVLEGRDVINAVTDTNTDRNTIYAFGGGNTVNRYMLDLLAYRNKGDAQVTSNYENIDDALPQFFQRVNDPILVDLNTDFGRIDEAKVFPKEMPDFYQGRQVEVYGRYNPAQQKDFVMRLEGKAADTEKELVFRADMAKANRGDESIARSWAFQKVYHLIGEICRVGERPELVAELQRLSRTYNIRTSYTN